MTHQKKLRQKTLHFFLFASISVIIIGFILIYYPPMLIQNLSTKTATLNQTQALLKKIRVGQQIFKVEIADTNQSRQQGLMWRESMPLNQGMLFVFDQSYPHGFWMKNTLIPLDMIWIDSQYRIVDHQIAQPCPPKDLYCPSYIPAKAAQYVLELNAHNFVGKIGDTVSFEF